MRRSDRDSSPRAASPLMLHVTPPAGLERSTHVLQVYQDEEFFAASVAEFVHPGLMQGRPAVVIATAAHHLSILAALEGLHADAQGMVLSGQLRLLDAASTLAQIMDGDAPSRARFNAVIGEVLDDCAREFGAGPTYAHGEMVDLLWRDGRHVAAAQLEELWNELAERRHFHLLCTYPMAGFSEARHSTAFERICGHHGEVYPTERYDVTDDSARRREVALLQQRAGVLERELLRRSELEVQLRVALADVVHAQQEVLDRERELTDCLEGAAEAIHWVGADGRILWANQAEMDLLGVTREEYIGRHVSEFHADPAVIDDMLRRLLAGETLRDYPARLLGRDGAIRHVQVNSNALWRDGKFVHTRCFTRDVTDAQRAAAQHDYLLACEQQARLEAEAANRSKSEFLAVMSHELRTPLNAIGGYVELIEMGIRGPVTDAQREDLGRIQKSQRHLLGLINEVLNYTRVDSGAMRYQIEPLHADSLVLSVEPLVRSLVDAKHLTLRIEPIPATLRLMGDRERVQQVLINLLSNAVKFTDRGGAVTISARAARFAGGTGVQLRVSDTGQGIPADKLQAVFDPFVQVHTGLTRPHEGVGLGLAISRDLARGMDGELAVESVVSVGSTFTLTLPVAPAQ